MTVREGCTARHSLDEGVRLVQPVHMTKRPVVRKRIAGFLFSRAKLVSARDAAFRLSAVRRSQFGVETDTVWIPIHRARLSEPGISLRSTPRLGQKGARRGRVCSATRKSPGALLHLKAPGSRT